MRILLDNAHGLNLATPGKQSPVWPDIPRLLEWRWTREMVERIRDKLIQARIPTHRLVPEYKDIPLWERCARANQLAKNYGISNCLLVSIHVNVSKTGTAQGWEIHTGKDQTLSAVFARYFWNHAKTTLPSVNNMRSNHSDSDPDWDSNYAILRDTHCPSVLTQNLFIDNYEDCKFLLSEHGKATIADLHVNAIKQITQVFNR